MNDDNNNITLIPLLRSKAAQSTSGTASGNGSAEIKKATGNDKIGQDEFLTMLIAQLKNQDPMDPMKGDEFAVNLAQFSQLERLISIDNKLGAESSTDLSSYGAYLGKEVTLNSNKVEVKGNEGGSAQFDLVVPSNDVRVQLLNSDGSVRKEIEVGQRGAGKHTVDLTDLNIPNGEYKLKVVSRGASGAVVEVPAYAAGTITGFVPGDKPVLLMGEREVKPGDIKMIRVPQNGGPA